MPDLSDLRAGSGPGGVATPEGNHRDGRLPPPVDPEQPVEEVVDEAHQDLPAEAERSGGRDQVGAEGAAVPEPVPVGPGPVLPGVPPRDGREHNRSIAAHHPIVTRQGREMRPVVSPPDDAEDELTGVEVVDAGLEPADVASNHVELGLVQGSGGRIGPEVVAAAEGVKVDSRDACRIEQQPSQLREVEPFRPPLLRGNRRDQIQRGRTEACRQPDFLRVEVDLERIGPVLPVEAPPGHPNRDEGVLGRLVVPPRLLGVPVHRALHDHPPAPSRFAGN